MKLNLITWNLNFIYDNCFERLHQINKILKKEINNTDIIALQEATLPFGNKIEKIYCFLDKKNIKYFKTTLLERTGLYNFINKNSDKYQKYFHFYFESFMNILLTICGYIFSYFGEIYKKIYFKIPGIIFFVVFWPLIPIILGMWFFFGLLTITNNKIKTQIRSKYIGNRIIQYFDFIYNNKEIRCVNIHLIPGNTKKDKLKKLENMKEIVEFCKEKKNVIILGDFNSTKRSKVYKYLRKNKYKNAGYKILGKKLKTFPADKPTMCIDFVMVKGNLKVIDAYTFGNIEMSDHKGLKICLDV